MEGVFWQRRKQFTVECRIVLTVLDLLGDCDHVLAVTGTYGNQSRVKDHVQVSSKQEPISKGLFLSLHKGSNVGSHQRVSYREAGNSTASVHLDELLSEFGLIGSL